MNIAMNNSNIKYSTFYFQSETLLPLFSALPWRSFVVATEKNSTDWRRTRENDSRFEIQINDNVTEKIKFEPLQIRNVNNRLILRLNG